jgi:hypothetical protein
VAALLCVLASVLTSFDKEILRLKIPRLMQAVNLAVLFWQR